MIFPYFYNSLNAGSPKVKGYKVDQLGQHLPEQDVALLSDSHDEGPAAAAHCAAAVGVFLPIGRSHSVRESPTRC